MLLETQRNDVFKLINKYGFNPDNFEWEKIESSRAFTSYAYGEMLPKLVYKETKHFFIFVYYSETYKYSAKICPGEATLYQTTSATNWRGLLNNFTAWLRYLKREIEQPDLWGEILKAKLADDSIISVTSNENFSEQELKEISEAVDRIRAYLESKYKFVEEEQKKINEQLDYLVSAAKRQGKKDWYYMCYGILLTLVITISTSPEEAKTTWEFIKSSFREIIQLLT